MSLLEPCPREECFVPIRLGPRMQTGTLGDSDPELDGRSRRKARVGALLTFRSYSPDEVSLVPASDCRRGDKLRVLDETSGGPGISVERIADGQQAMVWPEEVTYSGLKVRFSWSDFIPGVLWVSDGDRLLARLGCERARTPAAADFTRVEDEGGYAAFREAFLFWHNYGLPTWRKLPLVVQARFCQLECRPSMLNGPNLNAAHHAAALMSFEPPWSAEQMLAHEETEHFVRLFDLYDNWFLSGASPSRADPGETP